MAKRKIAVDVCIVPGCDRPIGNVKRQLCYPCDSSRHYWRRRTREDKDAMVKRREKLEFFTKRLTWLFKDSR